MLCPSVAGRDPTGEGGGKDCIHTEAASLTVCHFSTNKRHRRMKNLMVKREGETVISIRKNANQFTLKAPRLLLLLSSDH